MSDIFTHMHSLTPTHTQTHTHTHTRKLKHAHSNALQHARTLAHMQTLATFFGPRRYHSNYLLCCPFQKISRLADSLPFPGMESA